MKHRYLFLFCLLAALFFIGCGNDREGKFKIREDSLMDTVVDAADEPVEDYESDPDTIYPMQVAGKNYQLMFTHDEHRSASDYNAATITVRIIEDKTHDTLYIETFEFNSIGRFFHPAPDHYWINLTNESGGSGYSGMLFNIRSKPEFALQPVTDFSELSYWKSNKAATELIFFHALWTSSGDGEDFESHFSEHRQSIGVYKIMEDTILYTDIGMTKKKYDLHEHKFDEKGNDSIILRMKKNEPEFARAIRWEEYDLGE